MLSVMLAVFTQLALKGFCLPAEFSDENKSEGATDFVDIEGGGIGDGEGAKDVSDQIETEDQLDETQRPNDEKDEKVDQKSDIAPEDNAIEMSDDFDGKLQDLEPAECEEDDDSKDDNAEEDIEKQMGEIDGPDADKLDEQLWGSDEEEEPEKKDQKEEDGLGSGPQGEKELAAKEDLQNSAEDASDKKDEQKNNDENNDEDDSAKPFDVQEFDESEYDDKQTDPYHGDQEEKLEEPENLDLPDDLNLDQNEEGDEEDEGVPPAGEGEEDTESLDVKDELEEKEGEEPSDEQDGEKDAEDKQPAEREDKTEEERNGDETAEQEEQHDMEKAVQKEKEEMQQETAEQRELTDEDERINAKGFNPMDELGDDLEKEDMEEEATDQGKTTCDTGGAVESDSIQENVAADNNQEETEEGVGKARSAQQDGHQGNTSTQVTDGIAPSDRKQVHRKPGHSKVDRSLGTADEKFKRLKTTDHSSERPQPNKPTSEEWEASLYEHITNDTSHADAQALDVATSEQQQQQRVVGKPEDEVEEEELNDDDVVMASDEEDEKKTADKVAKDPGRGEHQQKEAKMSDEGNSEQPMELEKTEITGSAALTLGAERPPDSTIHTQLDCLHLGGSMSEMDVETLRGQLEDSMKNWTHTDTSDQSVEAAAGAAWQMYETLTYSLSQELCEQLRLILEPSQATKLKGDYRTGKRLNMRKVIPYIASQFRKDKIWLRRTKPSKRQYQIMLAIDDSSSMADNHSKQLAFESLALTTNALTLLETGDLAVCSFGETVRLLHPFGQPFSNQAGAHLLQQFTFEQKQTRVALMLQQATAAMVEVRSRQQGWIGRPETAQLLLIVSDGQGINAEGLGVVRKAVRQAREANIFLVFIILDNPKNQNSILDIKRTVFTPGKPLPEFRSYMEEFPFPFYVILRNINALPQVLSDALRQWFELVTATGT